MSHNHLFIFLTAFIFHLLSCSQEEICQDPERSLVNLGFYKYEDGIVSDTTLEAIAIKGIGDPDTLANDTASKIKSIQIPLPHGIDSCSFVFSFAIVDTNYIYDTVPIVIVIFDHTPDTLIVTYPVPDTILHIDPIPEILYFYDPVPVATPFISHYIDDTVNFTFSRVQYMVSAECGFSHLYQLLNVSHTHNVIHSMEIINPEINPFNEENIKILF